jgi:chitinase
MRTGRIALAGLVALLAGLAASVPASARQAPRDRDFVVAAYFADWSIYGRGYRPKQIPADKLTHLLYAFGKPTAAGTCEVIDSWADFQRPFGADESVDGADNPADPNQHLFGNFNQLRKLKQAHPNLKILIALGGWTLSTYFSDVAATPEARAKFVRSCIDTFIRGDLPTGGWPEPAGGRGAAAGLFDGIDLDGEFPGFDPGNGAHFSPQDKHNATLLIQEFRRQLADAAPRGKRYLLTAAISAGNVYSVASWELQKIAHLLDFINVLSYDFHGPWDAETNFNSPFRLDPADPTPLVNRPTWNVTGTVDFYLENHVPRRKIVLGVPFYARQYGQVPSANNGLYQPFDNAGLDPNQLQWDLTPTPTYHDLVDIAQIVSPTGVGLLGYTRYWGAAGEPWLYNPLTGRFISYDDPQSIAERVQLVKAENLGGAFAWEISQDADDHALVNAMSPLLP